MQNWMALCYTSFLINNILLIKPDWSADVILLMLPCATAFSKLLNSVWSLAQLYMTNTPPLGPFVDTPHSRCISRVTWNKIHSWCWHTDSQHEKELYTTIITLGVYVEEEKVILLYWHHKHNETQKLFFY